MLQLKEINQKKIWNAFLTGSQIPTSFFQSYEWGEFERLQDKDVRYLGIFDDLPEPEHSGKLPSNELNQTQAHPDDTDRNDLSKPEAEAEPERSGNFHSDQLNQTRDLDIQDTDIHTDDPSNAGEGGAGTATGAGAGARG